MAESRTSAAPVAVALTLLVFFLPVLYVLSIGPAAWLVNHNYLNENFAEAIYFPVLAAAERSEWLEEILQTWMELFE